METGASDPSYSGGVAACAVFSYWDFLEPWVADPGRGAERLTERLFEQGTGCGEAVSELCLEGCGLRATCGNRGQRTRLQWRLCRLRRGFVFGSFVAVGR